MSSRFCHNCGNPLTETAKFCGNCGTPVAKKADPAPQPEPEPVKSPVFTLDALEKSAVAEPAPVKTATVMSLDALDVPEDPEAPAKSEPESEPKKAKKAKKEKPVKEKKAKKEKPAKKSKGYPRRSGGQTVLAVLLCLVIFLCSFAGLTLLNVRLATTGEQAGQTAAALFNSLDPTKLNAGIFDPAAANMTLADYIAATVTEHYQGRVDLDQADLKEFWEDSSFAPFLSDHIGQCLADIYAGTETAAITEGEIQTLLRTDLALIDEIFDERLTEDDISYIAAAAVESGLPELISAKAIKANSGIVYTLIHAGFSWWSIGGAAGLLLILILLLGKINRSALRTFGDAGITLMVTSSIWCAGGLVNLVIPDLWNAAFYAIRPIGAGIGALVRCGLIPSAIAFGAGALLVIIHAIGKAIVTKSAKAQAE